MLISRYCYQLLILFLLSRPVSITDSQCETSIVDFASETSEMPSIYSLHVFRKSLLQTIPSVNKEQRLQPRKPDYLRDSFDLTSLVEASANGEARQPETSKDDESRPRDDLPEPTEQSRLQRHPLNRVADERSIDFGVSSEDDLPKSIDQVHFLIPIVWPNLEILRFPSCCW